MKNNNYKIDDVEREIRTLIPELQRYRNGVYVYIYEYKDLAVMVRDTPFGDEKTTCILETTQDAVTIYKSQEGKTYDLIGLPVNFEHVIMAMRTSYGVAGNPKPFKSHLAEKHRLLSKWRMGQTYHFQSDEVKDIIRKALGL